MKKKFSLAEPIMFFVYVVNAYALFTGWHVDAAIPISILAFLLMSFAYVGRILTWMSN